MCLQIVRDVLAFNCKNTNHFKISFLAYNLMVNHITKRSVNILKYRQKVKNYYFSHYKTYVFGGFTC